MALSAVYYAAPATHLYTWALIGYSSAAMVVLGVRRHRPARRLPWLLIAAALAFFTSGDTAYNLIVTLGHTPDFPGIADVFYLLVYPLLTGGFLVMVRTRSGGAANRAALLDALVPTVGFGLLSWVYWIAPFTRSQDLSVAEKLVSAGYPIGDVLALATLLRMLTVPGRRPRALTAISVALLGLLVSDIFYGQSQLGQQWSNGGPVDLGWIVFYATIGFAALLPSMRDLTEPAPQHAADMGPQRILWMSSAALIAPALLYLEWISGGGVHDAPVIAGAATAMFLIVIARINGLVEAQRQARARERALGEAGAALFSAASEEDVSRAVRAAVAKVMPPGEPYRLFFTEISGFKAPGIALMAAAEVPAELPVRDFDHFLYATVPLPGAGGRLAHGVLGARTTVLRDLLPPFEQLLTQVQVVLDRIGLTGEVNRRDSEAYFRTLIQNASDVILIIADDDTIRYASPSAATVFGYPDLTGTPLSQLIDDPRVSDGLDVGDLTVVRADGSPMRASCTGRDLRDDPTVGGLVLTVRDVTEQRRLEASLSHLAFHDGLTGLANRVRFRDRLEEELASDGPIGVLMVDLDDFKEVNDTLGHAVGDRLLVVVGERIASILGTLGGAALAARMGGDEFAVLVDLAADAHLADRLAGDLVEALAVPVEVSDGIGGTHSVSGGASVGVAAGDDADSATELLRHADLALYQAKADQKGTWQRYRPELHTAMAQRLETRAALREAVENEQFTLMYQPIVDIRSGVVRGVESLVRWRHPVRGLLGPAHFIEVAEESGVIVDIGNWVLRSALRQFSRWDADIPVQYVSVNVSARQFRTPGFVDQVRDALDAANAAPGCLLLEITESLLLRDADQVWADLRMLRSIGVRIAIDDFGTGYSSLSYLREMPVDVLKLDKSFIDDILDSDQQRIMVDTIVALARNLDLAVVAEGVEDPGQRALLARMGCPYGQGYLFAEPMWPDEIARTAAEVSALV
ncbi:EAL domain-containing protein [Actinoplanes sp. TBRC 11911]|nr:EAL domain-containing protein [Actinoplanes sp. TBRC 11911]